MFRRLRHLFGYLFRRRQLEEDLDEELRSSFEMMVEQLVARGKEPVQARRATRLEFEGLEQVKERVRDHLVGSVLQTFLQDVRYAWRGLRRRPSFALIALVTLSLGIGVNTAVFSVFYAVLMRPLPYEKPEQLALIWASFRTRGTAHVSVSGQIFREIEQRQRSMAAVAGIFVTPPRVFPGPPEQVKSALVTENFFDVLGVRAAHGRTFVKGDDDGTALMLTDSFFTRRLQADPSLIGKGVPDPGSGNTLVGVLPASFDLQFAPEANVPPDVQVFMDWGLGFQDNPNYIIRLVARRKPGVSMKEAQRDLDRVAEEIRRTSADLATEDLHLTVTGMQADAFRDVRPALTALFTGGAFVLLICCVNVASLLLARASDRQKEIALRLALGASRYRILRQLLVEAGVLSFTGGIAGLGIGWAVFRGLLAIRPERLARIDDAGLMWAVLAFAAFASLGAALLLGLAPAFQSFRMDHIEALRARGRGGLDRLQRRAGHVLVAGEIALGFVLVTGAALTARTLANIEQVRPGFEPHQLLAFQLPGMPPAQLSEWEARFAALPGVERAAAISHLPFDNTLPNWYGGYSVEGMTQKQVSLFTADSRAVTPGYFETMGVRLIEGRYFDSRDRAGAPNVVIVDELVARTTWPGQSALGEKINAEHMTQGMILVPCVVVGVVEHVRDHSLTKEVRGEIYSPFEQNLRGGYPQTFVLRTSVPPLSLVQPIRGLLRARGADLAMDKVRPMTDYVAREIAPAGFTAVLASIFGALALLLAATGIYGVLDYQVSRRLPEMGIRMAVGASARDVLALVLQEGLAVAALGVILGAVSAFAAARWLGALLYGVSAGDPLSYASALLLLPAAALLGCWRPAWRAAAANPAEIIREE
jgi:putative ABC transport system permease protein